MDEKLETPKDFSKEIGIIMRQTNVTQEQAVKKLNDHKGDYVNVIKEYLNIPLKKATNDDNKTINQRIFKEIRNNLYSQKDRL